MSKVWTPTIYFTVGPPGCGKSKWVKEKKKELEDRFESKLSVYLDKIDASATSVSKYETKVEYEDAAKRMGVFILNRDRILQMLTGGQYQFDECMRDAYREMALSLLRTMLNTGRYIIFDGTNITVEKRQKFIQCVASHNFHSSGRNGFRYRIVAVRFPVNCFSFCIKNRMKNSRGLTRSEWASIIKNMIKEYQAPSQKEGFDKIVRPVL